MLLRWRLVVPALVFLSTTARAGELDGVALDALSGGRTDLGSCPRRVCLTVYVAPWCHYCVKAMPVFQEMRARLGPRGVETRFIVGMDEPEQLRRTARQYGKDTLLDPDSRLQVRGVPHLILSDERGKVLGSLAGAPSSAEGGLAWVLETSRSAPAPVEPVAAAKADGSASQSAAPPAEMSLEDAAVNFETVVRTYVARKGSDGAFSLGEAGTGRPRRVRFLAVEASSVRKTAEARYDGRVALEDERTGRKVAASFVVDLSGPEWAVVSASLPSASVKPVPSRR
ncbi:MAG: TlpA family protein disulfide reductase [Elusimicrobia bacterium]|nr:TlpA family protein disulfide reductase [Elusimicrobiota bacterium]